MMLPLRSFRRPLAFLNNLPYEASTTRLSVFAALLLLTACGPSLPPLSESDGSDHIRLNQIGYYPGSRNQVVVTKAPDKKEILLVDASGEEVKQEMMFTFDSLHWELSGETVWPFYFIAPEESGTYRFYIPGVGYSHAFAIDANVLKAPFVGSVKGLYYQRASAELPESYAGKWHRPFAHPDTAVNFHPSSGITEGKMSSPKGWYDAGDLNKYVVNGSFPLGQLFALYEDIGDPIPDGQLNIPESGNGISDYLDEMRWEMDWLLTMQDEDGGLFHKLTAKNFEGMVMPHEATSPRFVVGKGTAATLDFAAASAQGARVYANYDSVYAEQLLEQSKRAWEWAKQYPAVEYTNPYDITTGQYGDGDFSDEWYWAAAELFVTTQEATYREFLEQNPPRIRYNAGETWTGFMSMLGVFSLLRNPAIVPASIYNSVKDQTISLADSLSLFSAANAYGQAITKFEWGSNSDALNAAMVVAAAHQLQPKAEYLSMIRSTADYILGKNAVATSFLTGFGDRTPMFIHHRQSAADGIEEPVPGLLSGGPNIKQQDKEYTDYPPNVAPMQSWADQEPSYASNEICLNWNAPLSYILGWLEHQ